jgi:hypothetical protein
MKTKMIVDYIRDISASLGGIRPLVQEEVLRTLHRKKDFIGIIRHIKKEMLLGMRLKIALVNHGGEPGAPAWVEMPHLMPLYGTKEFEDVLIRMYIRKSFLHDYPFETVVAVVAHELSHVVLKAIRHRLYQVEVAVDLTAMILGYRDFFRRGCEYSVSSKTDFQLPFLGGSLSFRGTPAYGEQIITTHRVGYLAREEVVFAADFMDFKP